VPQKVRKSEPMSEDKLGLAVQNNADHLRPLDGHREPAGEAGDFDARVSAED
jgi:hypothetical protein